MSDRELLELAGKALGIEVKFLPAWGGGVACYGDGHYWNPLTDDGDAFRLAVKLGLTININLRDEEGYSSASVWGTGQCRENARQGDLCGATRIAIVKMAAKIGRAT